MKPLGAKPSGCLAREQAAIDELFAQQAARAAKDTEGGTR